VTLKDRILALVAATPGLTDRELTDNLMGADAGQQAVNQAARALAASGRLKRHARHDGKLGNYPVGKLDADTNGTHAVRSNMNGDHAVSEDDVKRSLQAWLEAAGWQVIVKWGRAHGLDIDARRDDKRWVIEAKGSGSLDAMRVNYFLAILGELLQRMDDATAQYSVALPDMKQFRGLWSRLPSLAKSRTGITALFVAPSGEVQPAPVIPAPVRRR